MLRIGVPAAIEPRKKSITRFLDSILRVNKHGGRFFFASSSKSEKPRRPRRASSTSLVSKKDGTR
jgi:hypothetical protein